MNKKKIFSPSLYIEGLRQLKTIGLVSFAIYLLEAVLIPLNRFSNYSVRNHQVIVGINDMHPVIYITYTVLAPIFTLYLFNFLTRRDSSDFYHSIPHKRTCLYISYIASILTWLFFILTISSGVSILIHFCQPDIYKINFSMTLPYIAGIFIASAGVVCAVALAQCITGTFLSNIIVSGIILFFPRVFMEVIIKNILSLIQEIIPAQYFLPALNSKYNLITGEFINLFTNSEYDIFKSYTSWIYTLVLTIIYFVTGLVCFNKRHSETAGNSAPNKWIQAIYRICITLTFCLIPISIICSESVLDFTAIFSLYCIAAVIYFLFEIITTRTARNILKTLPGLVVIAILNVFIIFFVNTVSENELNKCPDASDVSYIQTIATDSNYIYYSDLKAYRYLDLLSEKIKINDSEMIESVISCLKADINSIKRSKSTGYYEYPSDYKYFAIHLKNGKTYYRRINTENIAKSSNTTFNELLNNYIKESNGFNEILDELPSFKDVSINMDFQNATKKQKQKIYNAFLEDYDGLSADEKFAFLDECQYVGYDENNAFDLDTIEVSFYTDGKYSCFYIPVSQKYKNTFKAYSEYYYDNDFLKNIKYIMSDMDKYAANTGSSLGITLTGSDQSINLEYIPGQYSEDDESSDYREAFTKELSALSEYIPETTDEFTDFISGSKSHITISIDYYERNETEYLLLPATDEITEIFNKLSTISDRIYYVEE